jgi:hypothetical protein
MPLEKAFAYGDPTLVVSAIRAEVSSILFRSQEHKYLTSEKGMVVSTNLDMKRVRIHIPNSML